MKGLSAAAIPLVLVSVAVAGCYESTEGEAPAGTDAGTTDPPVPPDEPDEPDEPDDPPDEPDEPDDPPDEPEDPPDEPSTCAAGDMIVFRPARLSAAREDPSGVAPGFNLDDRVSDDMDVEGCFQPDFVSPDGREGIDNQLAVLWPTLEGALGTDLDSVFARVQLAIGLRGVDSFRNDDCVQVTVYDVEDGSLVRGRTFESGRIRGGVLEARGGTFPVIVAADGTEIFTAEMRDARLRSAISSARLTDGVAGGTLGIEELVETLTRVDPSLPRDLIRSTLESVADLEPASGLDGVCEMVSGAVEIDVAERRDG